MFCLVSSRSFDSCHVVAARATAPHFRAAASTISKKKGYIVLIPPRNESVVHHPKPPFPPFPKRHKNTFHKHMSIVDRTCDHFHFHHKTQKEKKGCYYYSLVSCLLESLSLRKGPCIVALGPGLALPARVALLAALALALPVPGVLELPAALDRC